jgi:hypothetical protein
MATDPQPAIDSNTWYQLTESRVGFNSSLQYNGVGIFFALASDAVEAWQFYPVDSGNYQIRNKNTATNQLGTCHVSSEVTTPKTQPCMVPASSSDDSQKWTVDTWSDGTYKFVNVGNGTAYNMDCHPGNPLFMSDTTAESPKQPAQHWMIQSIGVINDGTFSTPLGGVCIFCYSVVEPLNIRLTTSRSRRRQRQHRSHPPS